MNRKLIMSILAVGAVALAAAPIKSTYQKISICKEMRADIQNMNAAYDSLSESGKRMLPLIGINRINPKELPADSKIYSSFYIDKWKDTSDLAGLMRDKSLDNLKRQMDSPSHTACEEDQEFAKQLTRLLDLNGNSLTIYFEAKNIVDGIKSAPTRARNNEL